MHPPTHPPIHPSTPEHGFNIIIWLLRKWFIFQPFLITLFFLQTQFISLASFAQTYFISLANFLSHHKVLQNSLTCFIWVYSYHSMVHLLMQRGRGIHWNIRLWKHIDCYTGITISRGLHKSVQLSCAKMELVSCFKLYNHFCRFFRL